MRTVKTSQRTMKAVVWTGPNEAVVRQEPVPPVGEDDVLLAVRATGICGSDLHGYRGHSPARVPPLILGHEVVASDEAGRRYVVNPLVGCSTCRMCLQAEPNLCPRRGLLGLDRPGAFAEHIVIPRRNLLPLPDGMDEIVATLVEPLATPVNAIRTAKVGEGSVVAVIGCGPIGLLACHAARSAGARMVVCYDIDQRRVRHGARYADIVGCSLQDVMPALVDSTEGLGADAVIDAVGVETTWNEALSMVRPGGTVCEIGLGQATGTAPVGKIVRNGIVWRGIYAYTSEDFAESLRLLSDSPPGSDWIETARLDEGPSMLRALSVGRGPLKAVFVLDS